ncbi:MAG: hypothetical protein HDR90_07005 [Bacteroides sp.]|nr:hypothetical protein [Bacteroides sp.]
MSIFSFFSRQSAPVKLPFATDMHCHLVPGVDDGSPDAATSVKLISGMHQWGIDRIIATPHLTAGTFENTPATLDPALDALRRELAGSGLPVEVSRSSENRLDDFFDAQLRAGNVATLPGNSLLIELPWVQEPFNLDTQLFDLKCQGYNIIIAHPERYPYYRHHPERYASLHGQDNLFQINLLSLAGHYGKAEKQVALHLLEKGMVDYIGTDIHNQRHVESIDAWLRTREARKILDAAAPRLRNDSLR